jgi:hypothetical protein
VRRKYRKIPATVWLGFFFGEIQSGKLTNGEKAEV